MPLNKKVKLLAQEFPELQTSRGWSLHWRLASPLLQSSLMLLMVVVGNCSVWTFTPSSLTSSQLFPTCRYSYSLTPISCISIYKSSWLSLNSLTHLHNTVYSLSKKFKSRWKLSGIAPCYSLFRGYAEVWQHKKTLPGKSAHSFWQSVF